MKPMRRQDRAVTAPEKIRAVIDACAVCRLGLQDGRGVYVVPVNFGHTVEGGRHVFYFHGAAEGRKVDLVRRNGWAGFELDTGYRLLGLVGIWDPWIPIINPPRDFWGWASLLCGIIGLVLVLLDNKNKD